MKATLIIATITALVLTISDLHAQDSTDYGFSIGTAQAGIGFGTLNNYSGIRLNLENNNNGVMNGLDIAALMWAYQGHHSIVNGIGFGLIAVGNARTNGCSISGFVEEADTVNGFSFGAMAAGGDVRNGLVVSGIMAGAYRMTGVSIAPMTIGAHFTGVSIGGLNLYTETTGVLIGLANIAVIPDTTNSLEGVEVGIFNYVPRCTGFQVGVVNSTNELHGVQIGLLNKAGNAVFKYLPFVNFAFHENRSLRKE